MKGFEHLLCSYHCIRCIGLSSPRLYVEVKFEKLITLCGLPLGLLVTLGGLCGFRKPQLVARCSGTLLGGSNSLWSSSTLVYRFGQRLKVDLIVERANPSQVKLTENRVSTSVLLECLGGSTPLQRRRTSIGKELRETSPRIHFAVTSIPKPLLMHLPL